MMMSNGCMYLMFTNEYSTSRTKFFIRSFMLLAEKTEETGGTIYRRGFRGAFKLFFIFLFVFLAYCLYSVH